jgi:L-amino acid N-acyltransferase YncA
MIRKANISDAKAIADIYNYYIHNTTITFEIEPVSESEMENRIRKTLEKYEWIVSENEENRIVGYSYYNSFQPRAAYKNSVEATIYLDQKELGKGNGNKLFEKLIDIFHQSSFHAIFGVIALPNGPSVRLHEKNGFIKVGELNEVGYKSGKWINVGYWELLNNNSKAF